VHTGKNAQLITFKKMSSFFAKLKERPLYFSIKKSQRVQWHPLQAPPMRAPLTIGIESFIETGRRLTA